MVVPRRLSDSEVDAMEFADHILNGTFRSRIFGGARKRTYGGMWSTTNANEHNSTWDFGTELEPDNAAALFDLMTSEIGALTRGEITDEEVNAARQYALGRHQMGAQTAGQINRFMPIGIFSTGLSITMTINQQKSKPSHASALSKPHANSINADCWLLGGIGNVDKAFVDGLHEKLVPLFEK